MSRKKGGLGQAEEGLPPENEDLLASVFGETISTSDARAIDGKPDTPPPPTAKGRGKAASKPERVGKYFMLDKQLVKAMKLYAVEHDMREIAVIETALRRFLNQPAQ